MNGYGALYPFGQGSKEDRIGFYIQSLQGILCLRRYLLDFLGIGNQNFRGTVHRQGNRIKGLFPVILNGNLW